MGDRSRAMFHQEGSKNGKREEKFNGKTKTGAKGFWQQVWGESRPQRKFDDGVVLNQKIFASISPMVYLSRLMGLSPYGILQKEGNCVLFLSKKYIFYSYALIIFLVFASSFGLKEFYEIKVVHDTRMKESTGRYVTYSDICIVLFSSCASVLVTPFRGGSFQKYIQCLNQIDHLLPTSSSSNRRKCIIVISITMLFTCSILLFDMSMWIRISYNYRPVITTIRNTLPYYLTYIFTMIVELNFWHLVYMIKVRIWTLNSNLKNILEKTRTKETTRKPLLEELIKHQSPIIVQKIPSGLIGADKFYGCSTDISHLMRVYELIYDAAVAVNEFYGFLMLIVIIGCLIHLLVTPYCLYLQIKTTGETTFIASQTIWMIGHVLRLILIVEPCQACLKGVKKTMSLVCKLLASEVAGGMRQQLELFTVVLANCRIQFSANGLTKIDRRLLTTITGAVSTYLVILFQFKTS